jgi:hypothetical protein
MRHTCARAHLLRPRVPQGSNYYFEVECTGEGAGAGKVCRNTKYGKDKKVASSEQAAAHEVRADTVSDHRAAVPAQDAGGGGDAEEEDEGFYGEKAREL